MKISLHIIVLILRGCPDWTRRVTCRVWINYCCPWCVPLLLHNYDKLSRIFSCLLLIRNHMILLVQFVIKITKNKILLLFKKIYSCPFIPNCSQNRVITCTNNNMCIWGCEFCLAFEHVTVWFTLEYWNKSS